MTLTKLIESRTKPTFKLLSPILFSTALMMGGMPTVQADETCMSPYMAKIQGQEDFVYVWTLGVEGMGDGQDKLVTLSVNPAAHDYGEVRSVESVGGRNEAHHSGFTDDRKYLWAGSLDTSKIFIFDVHTDPAKPKLVKTIDDFVSKTGGVVGPHTPYAVPGRMLWTALSNNQDHGGRTALVEYTNEGEYVDTYWIPTDDNLQGAEKTGKYADGYGYDIQVLPRRNAMFTSSFTGWTNYMMDFGQMLQDEEAMKRFGNTIVVWDLHTRQPKQVLDAEGAPLELRCAWGAENNYCFTITALTSEIILIIEDGKGGWKAEVVGTVANPSDVPLPVDFSISSDDSTIWVNTFMDGTTRGYDITDPYNPTLMHEQWIDKQVNMVSSSWDGTRLYYSSSLLGNWDHKGEKDVQYVKLMNWDKATKTMTEEWKVDFYKEKLGRAHQMRFGAYSLYGKTAPVEPVTERLEKAKEEIKDHSLEKIDRSL